MALISLAFSQTPAYIARPQILLVHKISSSSSSGVPVYSQLLLVFSAATHRGIARLS